MGIEVGVSILGIIVAAVISFWIFRRTNPKRELRYRVEVTPLLTAGATNRGRLTVALDGHSVTEPQILKLDLWSSGRADIGSQSFDAGAPLTFFLGARVVEEITDGVDVALPRLEVEMPDLILLRPALLHRKFRATAQVVVDGTPNVVVNRVLPDIEVVRDGVSEASKAIDTSRRRLRVTPLLISTGLLLLSVLLLVISLVIYSFDQQAYLPWGVVSILLLMVSSSAIAVIGVYRLVRWVGRNIEARSGLRRSHRPFFPIVSLLSAATRSVRRRLGSVGSTLIASHRGQ